MPGRSIAGDSVTGLIEEEIRRQSENLTLIASENYASRAVIGATGTVLTNKYADGYPGQRDYPGCEVYDRIETLARDRLRTLFGADHANVQPYSGSVANIAVFCAVLAQGDMILSLDVSDGGHHTHGSHDNLSGMLYRAVRYGVDEKTGLLDYAEIAALARSNRPAMLICGASAYPRTIDFRAFGEIAEECDAVCLADIAHISGLVATGLHPSPAGAIPIITTTTHKTLRGPRGGAILCDQEYADAIDRAVYPVIQGGPLMHVIAAKAVCFAEANTPEYREYCRQVLRNARALAGTLDSEGLDLVTGGTDNHLMVVDLSDMEISGAFAEQLLEKAAICADRCPVAGRKEDFTRAGGVRFGTPALTSRGMKEEEMQIIGHYIADLLYSPGNNEKVAMIREEVTELAAKFPIYPDIDLEGCS